MNFKGDNIKKNNDNVVFTFGRFQPPTIGHEKLIKKIEEIILSKENKADGYVFISQSQNKSNELLRKNKTVKIVQNNLELFPEYVDKQLFKNPLDVYRKTSILKQMFPETDIKFINTAECKVEGQDYIERTRSPCITIFGIINKLVELGYKNLTLVVGDDRYKEFSNILEDMNNKRRIEGLSEINIVDAGIRDELSEDIEGISGSKMRIYALLNDFDNFKNGIQTYKKDGTETLRNYQIISIMNDIVRGMGLQTKYVRNPISPRSPVVANVSEYYDPGSPITPPRTLQIKPTNIVSSSRPFEELTLEDKVGTKRRRRGGKRKLKKQLKKKTMKKQLKKKTIKKQLKKKMNKKTKNFLRKVKKS
jgi:hypothetical protein